MFLCFFCLQINVFNISDVSIGAEPKHGGGGHQWITDAGGGRVGARTAPFLSAGSARDQRTVRDGFDQRRHALGCHRPGDMDRRR